MMKKICLLLLAIALSFPSVAQSYSQLWKEVSTQREADLPRSALDALQRLRAKAVAEQDDAWLLRASLMTCVLGAEVSPDSAQAAAAQMEAALRGESRPVEQALWHSALAQTYAAMADNAYRLSADAFTADEWRKRAATHFDASIARPEPLAEARVADYLPLFERGAKSRPFSDDLLHVLLSAYRRSGLLSAEAEDSCLLRFITFYENEGRPEAALLLTLDRARSAYERANPYRWGRAADRPLDSLAYYRELRELAAKHRFRAANVFTYVDLIGLRSAYEPAAPAAAHNDSLLVAAAHEGLAFYGKETAAGALRRFVQEMENPAAEIESLASGCYPAERLSFTWRARHLKEVQLRLTPIYDDAAALQGTGEKDWKRRAADRRKQAVEQTFRVPAAAAYAWTSQTVDFDAPAAPGIYLAELRGDGRVLATRLFRVTTLRALVFAAQGGSSRVVVADARTGRPVAGAAVTAYTADSEGRFRQLRKYTADAEGTVQIVGNGRSRSVYYAASTATDRAAEPFTLSNHVYADRADEPRAVTQIDLFTDRAIYRPSQEVAFSGVVYTASGDDFRAVEGYEAKAVLRNANGKILDSLLVRTDAFGSFSGTFRLPEAALPGRFSIEARGASQTGWRSFRVEEYKRPTFTAETAPVTTAYALGDTVRVDGVAKTYSGVPVSGARVTYRVERSRWYLSSYDDVPPQSGETVTDADGRFVLPVSLTRSTAENQPEARYRLTYTVSYTVTADNGETAQGSTALSVSSPAARLEADVPATLYRRDGWQLPAFTVKQLNAADENLAAAGTYRLLCGTAEAARGSFRTGEPFRIAELATLPADTYSLILTTTAEAAPDTVRLTLLDANSSRVTDRTAPLFSYSETSAAGDTTRIVVGTPERDAVLFYDLLADGRPVESRRLTLSDSLVHLTLTYRPDYGDGATAFFALLRNGELHTFSASVRRPEPEKRLMLRWETFRSRLTPGQQEEWTLRLTTPDGSPARAQLMAGMWDASLDAFAQNVWGFSRVFFTRRLPAAWWRLSAREWAQPFGGSFDFKAAAYTMPALTQWRAELFDYGTHYALKYAATESSGSPRRMRATHASLALPQTMESMADASMMRKQTVYATNDAAPSETGATNGGATVAPRTNFAETAFFQPALRTDENGEVRLAFTLPETMTRWHFSALAHDGAMNFGRLDTTVVARKEFMAELSLPRFLRSGDRAALPAKLTNLTERTLTATVRFSLTDAVTGRTVCTAERRVELAPQAVETCTFDYEAAADAAVLTARVTAEADGFSDGEERYLPVLSSDVEVTRTLPFSLTEKGSHTFAVDTLFDAPAAKHRALTVELSANPTWYAVTALPALSGSEGSVTASQWATRFYALTLGRYVATALPALRTWANEQPAEAEAVARLRTEGLTDATPWLGAGETEAASAAALRRLFDEDIAAARLHTTLDRLAALQQADGGWSWCPGMPTSPFITADVAVLLARAEKLTGDRSAHDLLSRACDYLKKSVAADVAEMKRAERAEKAQPRPSETHLRFLYLRALLGEQPDADANYLLDAAERHRTELTMYGKALAAVALAEAGRSQAADLAVRSLLEHTVTKAGFGRWFDTPRAEWSWQAYRVPTQCAALEALRHAGRTTEADEMRLWLLQAKRTQMWETGRATADAVYALLAPTAQTGTTDRVMPLAESETMTFTLRDGERIVGFNAPSETTAPTTLGYTKETYTDAAAVAAKELVVRKTADGLSWGAAYASYSLPASEVRSAGKGLMLSRRFEVLRGTTWQPVDEQTTLRRGDRVRQLLTLTADRDYDFVTLSAARPACLEPARPLSGYNRSGELAAYRAVRDDRTDFYVERVRKGTHHLVEEFFTDRAGRFASGIAQVECTYAPEFTGTAAETTLTAE